MSDQRATPTGGSHIHHLDDLKSVDEFCQAYDTVLLSIVHVLVSRCQAFLPVFEEVAEALCTSGSDTRCAQIQAANKIGLGARFHIRGFPTLVLCHGKDFRTYRGPLRKGDILAFLKRREMAAVSNIKSSSELNDFRSTHSTVIVAFLRPEDQTTLQAFTAVAEEMKEDIVFCISNHDTPDGTSMPSVVVYKNVPEEKSVLPNPSTADAIREFIQAAAQPLVTELLPELHKDILEQPLPLGYLFISSPSQQPQATADLLPLAREYHHVIQLCTVNTTLHPDLPSTMHLPPSQQHPSFAIHSAAQNRKYPLTQPATPPNINLHISNFLAGTLKPSIKSAPIPSTQPSPVIEVVGLTYDDIILDPTKDVLVEFYTQSCAPCKALLPQYEKLAAMYAQDEKARDKVAIAKLDFEANDVPDGDIRGFPWFKLYPVGRKGSPATYGGEMGVEGWSAFVKEEGGWGV
ncbi:disulfide isomerase PDI1 protein [Immersiella caudata]|uniref:Protein disulfide-isomerase n=1 Tax=Immersiella caudata TaxID=314043 RepID=A0AA39WNZ3_9PEZI|nr:disulfide isomerase PDI1 protein [Immersiella caudata]